MRPLREPVERSAAESTALVGGAWRLTEPDGTVVGFVVIDRVVAGRACGGIRAGPQVTQEEIARIARVMTLKCGFSGLAAGGAKGGVVVPADFSVQQRAARLEAFGRAAAPLLRSGVWSHGADMGTTELDIARIRHAAGVGPPPSATAMVSAESEAYFSSGTAAGMTVALATEAALDSLGVQLRGARIAVQGAGAVGRAAIRMLAAGGARVVGLSTVAGALLATDGLDVDAVLGQLAGSAGESLAGMLPRETLFQAPCDALLLCAGSDALDLESAQRVQARTVVCGGNIPFTRDVQAVLEGRGVMVVPDFVASAGGILGSTLAAVAGVTTREAEAILRRRYKTQVAHTIERARTHGTSMTEEAQRSAERVITACEAVYGSERPETLLPEKFAPSARLPTRLMLAAERRLRGSVRLAAAARLLHGTAVRRAERVLAASLAVALTS